MNSPTKKQKVDPSVECLIKLFPEDFIRTIATETGFIQRQRKIEEGFTNFDIALNVHNDPAKWAKEYRGYYLNTVYVNTSSSGKIKVTATIVQDIGVPDTVKYR